MDEQQFDGLMQRAIDREVEARDFYRGAAERMKDDGVREIFLELSREEEKHRETLETFRFDPTAKVQFAKVAEDFRLAEASDDVPLSLDLEPKAALQLAMKKEQAAKEAYEALAGEAEGEVRDVFLQLARMEAGHKQRLETMFTDVAFPEAW